MARKINRLTALAVRKATKPGRYRDGRGLALHIRAGGSRQWVFRYQRGAVEHEMSFGSALDITLEQARALADGCRSQLRAGIDPIEARRQRDLDARLAEAKALTFNEARADYIAAMAPGWRNSKHAQQWANTLETYAAPLLGTLPVQDIDEGLVLKVLQPLWDARKVETGKRVRGRIEAILDRCTALKRRSGPNPARWRGNLDALLAAPSKVRQVRHQPAMPYVRLPAFIGDMRKLGGTAPRGLEFCILTAARSGEVRGAVWSEIDLDAPGGPLWTVPGERVKSGRQHRVPLPPRAVEILRTMMPLRDQRHGDFVFPGGKAGRPLSDAAFAAVLDRMGVGEFTPHGFRSTFRDWCGEQTAFAREIAEACLAHRISDAVERAYLRSDFLEKRRRLLGMWADYCATERPGAAAENVVSISAAG